MIRPPRLLLRAALVVAAAVASGVPGRSARGQEEWRTTGDVAVRYAIEAELRTDPESMWIKGIATVTWRNPSGAPVDRLLFHLAPNALLNNRSTFLREYARRGGELPEDMRWGELDVQQVRYLDAELALEYVSPDDANPDDRTVARVRLPEPVPPGAETVIKIDFTTRLPTLISDLGHVGEDFVLAAHWYPQLGRLVPGGAADGWECRQRRLGVEPVTSLADYAVSLTVPEGYVTGATGTRAASAGEDARDRDTERWTARSVTDFAWVAGRRLVARKRTITPVVPDGDDPVSREWRRVRWLLGLDAEAMALPPVEVTLLVQPEHEAHEERWFEAARAGLGLFGTWLGPYPYGQLTIVDPPHAVGRAADAGHPQLVVASSGIDSPRSAQRPESAVVRGVGAQWFGGPLAPARGADAWLAAGPAAYFSARAGDVAYGPARLGSQILGIHFGTAVVHRFPGLSGGWPEAVGLPEWARPPELDVLRLWRDLPPLAGVEAPRYRDDPLLPLRRTHLGRVERGEGAAEAPAADPAAARAALFLGSLRRALRSLHPGNEVGAEQADLRFLAAMRRYARDWRFRHPTTDDFLAAFEAAANHGVEEPLRIDARRLHEALMRGSGELDYAVEDVRVETPAPFRGRQTDEDGADPEDGDPEDGVPSRRVVVTVRRGGEVVVPQTLEVTLRTEHGGAVRRSLAWDGRDRRHELAVELGAGEELESVRLDPGDVYLQDVDRSDNSRASDPSLRPAAKWSVRVLIWLENALCSYGRFF